MGAINELLSDHIGPSKKIISSKSHPLAGKKPIVIKKKFIVSEKVKLKPRPIKIYEETK